MDVSVGAPISSTEIGGISLDAVKTLYPGGQVLESSSNVDLSRRFCISKLKAAKLKVKNV